jgi:hypothetical protein
MNQRYSGTKTVSLLVVIAIVVMSQVGCSEESRAKSSLESAAKKEYDSFCKPKTDAGRGLARALHEECYNYHYDIQRTNSVTTPYTGTIVITYEQDSLVGGRDSVTLTENCTYSEGEWRCTVGDYKHF